MTTHQVMAGVLAFWLFGAVVGWVAGWVARGDFNRAWWRGTAARLAETQAQLAQALRDLDDAHAWWEAHRVSPPAAPVAQVAPVVHVHVAAPLPWVAHPPLPPHGMRVLDAVPVAPVGELPS